MGKLTFSRPLVALDLETTGTDPKTSRIVQMAVIKTGIGPEFKVTKTSSLFNPGIPIPAEATEVHGITDEMVKNQPTFAEKAPKLWSFIASCDLLTYNGNRFDIPLLFEEFARCGITWDLSGINFIDAMRIYQIYEKRDLAAAVKRYTGKVLEGGHDAMVDTTATVEVFMQQLEQHADLPDTMEGLNILCNNDKERIDLYGKFAKDKEGDYIYTFGKHMNKKCKDVVKEDPGYSSWMLGADFSTDTKAWCKKIHDSFTQTPPSTTAS